MNDNKELIVVPYNVESLKGGVVMLAVITVFMALILWGSSYLYILIGAYFTRVITLLLGAIAAYFTLTFLYTLWFILFNNKPAVILNPEGIWVDHFGFIEWNDVQSCEFYKHPGIPLESVSIVVKDVKKLSRQANIAGKITIMCSRLFHFPYILISNVTVENGYMIFSYVQAHIKETE